jgi:hypothetical protein
MSNLKVLVWQNREGTGQPDVEIKIPVSLAKWLPRLMKLVPRKTKEETWGQDVNFDELFADIERLVNEAAAGGHSELMEVNTKDSHVKITVEP